MKLQLMIILVISLANSQWSGDGSGGWNDDDDEGSGGGDDDDDGFSGDDDDESFSGDDVPLGDEDLDGQEKFGGRGGYSDSYEDDNEEDAYIEEEYEAILNSYSEEMYDDTTADSLEVFKEAVHNRTNSEEVPVYDYSDITDSEGDKKKPSPKSNMDASTQKVAGKTDSEEVSKESSRRKQHPTSHINDVTIRKLAGVNSGQSSRINCLLLIIALTVHWMFVRFRIQSRRQGPRRVIQIRRPAHLH